MLATSADVRVAVEQDIALAQRGQGLFVEAVTVGREDHVFLFREDRVIREDREFQYHLIDLRVAVSANAENGVLSRVEQGNDLLGRVAAGEIVSGTVV